MFKLTNQIKYACLQKSEWLQFGNRFGDFPFKFVVIHIHANEVFQITQFLWYLPSNVVPIKLPETPQFKDQNKN